MGPTSQLVVDQDVVDDEKGLLSGVGCETTHPSLPMRVSREIIARSEVVFDRALDRRYR